MRRNNDRINRSLSTNRVGGWCPTKFESNLIAISQALESEVDLEVLLLSVLLGLESLLLLSLLLVSPLLLSPLLLSAPSLLDDDSLSFFALSLYPSLR